MSFLLTPEQQEIIDSNDDITINAVAGSGKTTTLVAYAKSRPASSRILYLAFNKSVRIEAAARFKRNNLHNVQVETAHSLAFRHIVKKFGYALHPTGYRAHDLVKILGLKSAKEKHSEFILANHISALYAYYCNSSAQRVTELDYAAIISDPRALAFVQQHYELIQNKTRLFLDKMNRGKIAITHDFYLKKFQLSQPKLPYSYILFDEGQDASPAMLDVFLRQKATKVIVGDTHQQIYGWRYAVNSLDKTDFKGYMLSNSFRFGAQIAELAMAILAWKNHLGEIALPTIYGLGKEKSIKSRAMLARSNMGLLLMAINYVTKQRRSRKIYFEGNINSYTYATEGASLYDVLALYNEQPHRVRDAVLKNLRNRQELDDYIAQTGDMELSMMADIVREYGNEIPSLIAHIKAAHVDGDEKSKADMVFSTIHRCKGMEYDEVTLADDFLTADKLSKLALVATATREKERLAEEVNLLYVAATRAECRLSIPETLLPTGIEVGGAIRSLKQQNKQKKPSNKR